MNALVAQAIKNREKLISYICKKVGSYHEAKDIYQEGLITLSRSLKDGLEDEENMSRYVTAIMRNRCIDVLRKRQVDRKHASFMSIPDKKELEVTTGDHPETDFLKAERNNKLIQVVTKAIARIENEEQREVVLLHYLEGYKFREIAERNNISQMDVKNLNYRAISKLKSLIPQHVYRSLVYTLLAFILSFNCIVQAMDLDPEFKLYLDEFIEHAKYHNTELDTSNLLGIYFSDVSVLVGVKDWRGVVVTGADGKRFILINRYKWFNNHPSINEQVIFHELGHALLNRDHEAESHSIMQADKIWPDYEERKEYYIHELFNPTR